jgi:hypothetical protein
MIDGISEKVRFCHDFERNKAVDGHGDISVYWSLKCLLEEMMKPPLILMTIIFFHRPEHYLSIFLIDDLNSPVIFRTGYQYMLWLEYIDFQQSIADISTPSVNQVNRRKREIVV